MNKPKVNIQVGAWQVAHHDDSAIDSVDATSLPLRRQEPNYSQMLDVVDGNSKALKRLNQLLLKLVRWLPRFIWADQPQQQSAESVGCSSCNPPPPAMAQEESISPLDLFDEEVDSPRQQQQQQDQARKSRRKRRPKPRDVAE